MGRTKYLPIGILFFNLLRVDLYGSNNRYEMTALSKFIKLESTSSLLLIFITAIALVWVNSPWAEWYHQLWK